MKDFLQDLFFPRVCLGCGFLGSHLCPSCAKEMKKVQKDRCFYCKKPSFLGLTHPNCKKKSGIDGIITVFYYSDIVKKIIKNIKYRLVSQGIRDLCLQIPQDTYAKLDYYNKLYKNLAITPIPLSAKRKRQRGFNQAEKLADSINQFLSYPRAQNLIKYRETKSQSQIPALSERKKNVRDVFTLTDPDQLKARAVLLVDDVVTTGATVAAAGKALKEAGVSKVVVFALAKG